MLVGTFPLDLTVPGSALDIICEILDWALSRQSLASFVGFHCYAVR